MKVAFIASSIVLFSTCNDNKEEDNTPGTSTETTAESDNSNFGLYKGVIVGSSGTIKIEIINGNNVAKARITIDGNTDNLTCSTPLSNRQVIENAEFTGDFSSFNFSVSADGSNPVVSDININGHDDAEIAVLKEESNNVVSCFEGTSAGGNDHEGVFNVVRKNNIFSGLIKGSDGFTANFQGSIDASGNYTGNSTTTFYPLDDHVPVDVTLNYNGRFIGNDVSGTWDNSWDVLTGIELETFTNSGTSTGKKTL